MAEDNVNRRSFLKQTLAGSTLAAAFTGGYFALRDEGLSLETGKGEVRQRRQPVSLPPERPALCIARGEDPEKLTAAAFKAFGGLAGVVSSGDVVLIKPNIGWDRPARLGANTNPAVVRTIARLCVDAGAKRVIVSDNPCNNPVRCFDRSGVKKALGDLPVEIHIPTERDFVEIDIQGQVVKTWPVLRVFLECDRLINVPVAKHHSSAVLTMGMKNWYGILGGGRRRGELHQNMARSIADLAAFARPDLTVLDAYRVVFRNGPQGGSPRDTREFKTVALGTDPVAIDAFGATLFDLAVRDIPYIPLGVELGLGTADFDSLSPVELEV